MEQDDDDDDGEGNGDSDGVAMVQLIIRRLRQQELVESRFLSRTNKQNKKKTTKYLTVQNRTL